ncbi:MAG: hypothetical protein ABIO70_18510 [Pseudomonadota bacterium]
MNDPGASAREPDTAAWWREHLSAMVSHEQVLQHAAMTRAVVLALVATAIAVGGPLLLAWRGWWGGIGWLAGLLLVLGFGFALASAVIFWLSLAPMEGRGWRPHTLTAWLHTRASEGLGLDFLAGLLPDHTGAWRENLRQARRLRPDLSEKVKAAVRRDDLDLHLAHRSPEARAQLEAWLREVLGADLGWWLAPGEDEEGDRRAAARVRLVFWLWLHRHVAQAMADMCWLGVKLGVTAMFFTIAALAVLWIGWWLLLVLPIAGGLLGLHWAFTQARP